METKKIYQPFFSYYYLLKKFATRVNIVFGRIREISLQNNYRDNNYELFIVEKSK